MIDVRHVYLLGSEQIANQRIDNINNYWEAEFVNAYKTHEKSMICQRNQASYTQVLRGGRAKGRVKGQEEGKPFSDLKGLGWFCR